MKTFNEYLSIYTPFTIYTCVGILLRYFITLPCGFAFENIHVQIGYDVILYVVSVTVVNLYSFISQKPLPRSIQPVFVGLSTGYGLTTVVILLFFSCH